MFTYVHLKNFKSFGDVTFNLCDKHGLPKKLAIVYGENGIGKSNLMAAFYFFVETLHTMDVRDLLQNIFKNTPEDMPDDMFRAFIRNRFKDTEALIHEYKMAQSSENLYLEFGFRLAGKEGKYVLEMNDDEIVSESLEYILVKRRGKYFDLTKERKFLSDKVFLDSDNIASLNKSIEQFWGKHTFLSLLLYDISDKNHEYYDDLLSDNLKKILSFITSISCKIKCGNRQEQGILSFAHNRKFLNNYAEGKISFDEKDILKKSENMLRYFLTTLNNDIKGVFYKQKKKNNHIQYKLYIKKNIYGQDRELRFDLESTGTQKIVELLPYLLTVSDDSIVIIDELDLGIHDVLVENIVRSLRNYINGQLIITTHNTLLMESDIPPECFYVINELPNGHKEISCILKYDNKIGNRTNMRKQFLLGKYHGVPEKFNLDFNKLKEYLYT